MLRRAAFAFCLTSLIAGCAEPTTEPPSLARRAAEGVDPRLPVGTEEPVIGPADPALVARLSELTDRAAGGDAAFQPAVADAERLAAAAGGPQSESWVAAQQALSAAIAAREPTVRAMGDIDALAADNLSSRQWIAPGDLAVIRQAAEEVSALDERQAARLRAIEARLGL